MTLHRLLCLLAITSPLLCSSAALAQPAGPPLDPNGEAPMDDPSLAAGCLQRAVDLGAKLNSAPDSAGYFDWKLGAPLITHSDDWGVICRIDFVMAGADVAPRVNRLVMYNTGNRNDVMIAFGQDVAPLISATPVSASSH